MSTQEPRLFELKEGTSDKFWEISLDGTSHTVRYGRIGTDGQSKTKDFDSEDKAQASYEKLIKQKTGKGYTEVTGSDDSRQHKAKTSQAQAKEREPFISAILNDPDDPAGYMVYADWLEDRADPQAELIRIQWQLEDEGLKPAERKSLAAREKSLLKKHEATWLGDLADDLIGQKCPEDLLWNNKKAYQWEMARGWLDALHIEYLLPDFAQALKKSPLTTTLRRLTIQNPSSAYDLEEIEEYSSTEWDEDDSPALKLLSGTRFTNLRYFEVSEREEMSCHAQTPTVHNLLKLMPRLESLHLDAHELNLDAIFRSKLPQLRSLTLQHTADRYPLEVLARNKSMTQLESLYLWPHALDYGDDPYIDFEGFRALCRSKNLPSLRHLSLHLTHFGDAGISELVKSELFTQLKSVRLVHGSVSDVGAETLCAADLTHLDSLDLSNNYISTTGVASLKEAFPAVVAGSQYEGQPDDDEMEHLWHGDIE